MGKRDAIVEPLKQPSVGGRARFQLLLTPELRDRVKRAAARVGLTAGRWIVEVIERALGKKPC